RLHLLHLEEHFNGPSQLARAVASSFLHRHGLCGSMLSIAALYRRIVEMCSGAGGHCDAFHSLGCRGHKWR
ncbi:hypothetical protein A2U01_0036169, partial [Trifolium medium]|nr:hypothetical protein [Trifolium medium]